MVFQKCSQQACTSVLYTDRGGSWRREILRSVAVFLQFADHRGYGRQSARLGSLRTDKEPNSIRKFVDQARPTGNWSSLCRTSFIFGPGVPSFMFIRVTSFHGSLSSSRAPPQDSCCFRAGPPIQDQRRPSPAVFKEAFLTDSCYAVGARSPSTLRSYSREPCHSFTTPECSPAAAESRCARRSVTLLPKRTCGEKSTFTAFVGSRAECSSSNDGTLSSLPPFSKMKLYLFDQRRYVRPNRGRNDYQRVGGKKSGRKVEAMPETLELLMKTQDAEATTSVLPTVSDCFTGLSHGSRPGVPMTEAMAVPTVAAVNAPLPIQRPRTSCANRSTHLSSDRDTHCSHPSGDRHSWGEQDDYLPCSTQSTGRLDSVALHVGDVSRLRVDATIFGALPSLKIAGGGRGFVGCSSLIAGAGPMLPLFVSQQRHAFINSGTRSPDDNGFLRASTNAAVAVAALREGVERLVRLSSEGIVKTSFEGVSAEEVSKLPAAALSAVAASAARHFLAGQKERTSGSDAHAVQGENIPSIVAPASLLQPGAVMLSPGFSLPSAFLVHVVEPNAIYSSEHFFRALVRFEELGAAKRRNDRAMASRGSFQNREGDWQEAIQDKSEKSLVRCCWERMRLLEDCYVEALNAAAALGVQSVAVPCLGAGAGRFPPYIAARCAARAVGRWMNRQTTTERNDAVGNATPDARNHTVIERVVFCTTSDKEWKALRHFIPAFFA